MTIIADPAASFWLKKALRDAMNRDPVDAANDAEVLARFLKDRADVINKNNMPLNVDGQPAALDAEYVTYADGSGRFHLPCGYRVKKDGLCGCAPGKEC